MFTVATERLGYSEDVLYGYRFLISDSVAAEECWL